MFYKPVKTERFFEKDRLYASINTADLKDIVSAWERRMKGWYIEPVEVMLNRDVKGWKKSLVAWIAKRPDPGHYAFTVMSITCLLIDALSQYRFGELASKGEHFKRFVEDCLFSYKGTLPQTTWHYDHSNSANGKRLMKYSEVLWNGYRCGILHQAHAPLYCGIVPGNFGPRMEPTNHAEYGPSAGNAATPVGSNCPTVVVCPEHLFDEVRKFLDQYINDLTTPNPIHDSLRLSFKKKFSDSFGLDITGATL